MWIANEIPEVLFVRHEDGGTRGSAGCQEASWETCTWKKQQNINRFHKTNRAWGKILTCTWNWFKLTWHVWALWRLSERIMEQRKCMCVWEGRWKESGIKRGNGRGRVGAITRGLLAQGNELPRFSSTQKLYCASCCCITFSPQTRIQWKVNHLPIWDFEFEILFALLTAYWPSRTEHHPLTFLCAMSTMAKKFASILFLQNLKTRDSTLSKIWKTLNILKIQIIFTFHIIENNLKQSLLKYVLWYINLVIINDCDWSCPNTVEKSNTYHVKTPSHLAGV